MSFSSPSILVLLNAKRKINHLSLVTMEDTAANAQQRSVVVAGSPTAVSCIQFRKSKFMYICTYMDVFEAWDVMILIKLLRHPLCWFVKQVNGPPVLKLPGIFKSIC